MSGKLLTPEGLTALVFLVPLACLAVLWVWFKPVLRTRSLYQIFLELFTLAAAVAVLLGALMPRYFDFLQDRTPFLVIVSLSALLHATSSVATMITEARSDPDRRPDRNAHVR